jgi:RHS repeat-associated protein
MVLALARPEAEESQSEFPCRFLTQKELDPDAVAFNSNNNRYHFPFRFYLSFRGHFGQLDPFVLGSVHTIDFYAYALGNPPRFVDPFGLYIGKIDEDPGMGGGSGFGAGGWGGGRGGLRGGAGFAPGPDPVMEPPRPGIRVGDPVIGPAPGPSPTSPYGPPYTPPTAPGPTPSIPPTVEPVPPTTGGPRPGAKPKPPTTPSGDPMLPAPGPSGGESPLQREKRKCDDDELCNCYCLGPDTKWGGKAWNDHYRGKMHSFECRSLCTVLPKRPISPIGYVCGDSGVIFGFSGVLGPNQPGQSFTPPPPPPPPGWDK